LEKMEEVELELEGRFDPNICPANRAGRGSHAGVGPRGSHAQIRETRPR
jgi:hypothetical protein